MIHLFQRILKLSGSYRKRIEAAFVFSFLKAVLAKMPICLAFFVLSKFYDRTLTAQDCIYTAIAMVLIVLCETLCQFFSDRLQSAAGYMMFAEKRLELGKHLRRLPMGYFTAGNIGKISSVLSTDMIFVEEAAMSTLASMMSYLFAAVILAVFMLFFDVRLGVITIAVSLAAAVTASKMNKVSLREADKRQEQSERLTDAVLSFVEGIGIIKSYNLLGDKSRELTENFRKSKDQSLEFEEVMVPWQRGLNIIYALGMTGIFGYAVMLQQDGEIALPSLCGLLLFLFDLFGPLKALYGESSRLTVMNSCLDRIETVLNETELPDTGREALPEPKAGCPEIEFQNVSFSYETKEVLHQLHFSMYPHTMTALAGPSGSGKSTIANLIARFWDTSQGKILIRGHDVRDIPLASLMDQISMVFQRVYLFQDTIYENIRIGKPGASREEVCEAAKKARCYDFIMGLPDGFETMIGEGGATLSGGEKQRISIARCILKDAPLIILDEATASVDVDNERYIQEAISELVKGKTLLVIAHRLNTIKAADQILVIDQGWIVQRGTHEQLIKEDGIYRQYIRKRSRQA